MFDDLMKDNCFVIDANGNKSGPFKTAFTRRNSIRIFDPNFEAQEGDSLIQPLPNGKELSFLITGTSYQSGLDDDIPGNWQVVYAKGGTQPKQPQVINPTYNFHGANNVQIGDNNIQNIRSAVETLVHGINNAQTTPEEKDKAKGLLRTFLENPTTASVLGAAATGVLALLG
ncbi:RHIM domain-containing protein [Pseudomonas sp. IT-232MI5]|jgi:hypothetical protein|uniref:hypothetical protein n=1 Tax=Pseudomonas sp. IT-232MI5 TaxID=3026442 RepID=UPI0039E139B0